jgi:hypothetical protein
MYNINTGNNLRFRGDINHKGGQILLCTAGRGYYQEWGKEPQELHHTRLGSAYD